VVQVYNVLNDEYTRQWHIYILYYVGEDVKRCSISQYRCILIDEITQRDNSSVVANVF